MLASIPASILNQNPTDLGTHNRFSQPVNRSRLAPRDPRRSITIYRRSWNPAAATEHGAPTCRAAVLPECAAWRIGTMRFGPPREVTFQNRGHKLCRYVVAVLRAIGATA